MDSQLYGEFLKTHLPIAKYASGKTEIVTRCQYCPDSKDKTKGHFYISIPQDESQPSKFYCQKCGACGIVTTKKLIEWGIYDTEAAIELANHNKKLYGNGFHKFLYKNQEVYNISYSHITDDKLSKVKLDYINKRLGTNLTYQDCIREKIIINIQDLIKENNLSYTRHDNIVNALDNGFVGFLSYDNSYVNMRNIDILNKIPSSIDKRYVNYSVLESADNTKRFYVIPNRLNLMDMNPIHINIAEGPFDILSIYHNIRKEPYNNIYASIGGKRYLGLIRYFINELRLVNIVVHLYLDADIEPWIIDDIVNTLDKIYVPVMIHRNVFPKEKDFGVPLNRIKETIQMGGLYYEE